MLYPGIDFKSSICVKTIYSIHYYEYRTDFSFPGESHDFWEFVYADKGETIITSGSRDFRLKAGELYFHKPNEFHAVRSDGEIAPNLIVVSFDLLEGNDNYNLIDSIYDLAGHILHIDQSERHLLASIIQEAKQCFSCRLDDPYSNIMPLKDKLLPGSGQLIKIYLEEFLIHILRRFERSVCIPESSPGNYKLKNTDEILSLINDYLKQHIHEQISVEQICHDNLIGRTQLQKMMKEQFNLGIIQYFHQLKIETAKEMIRSGRLNFTQIASKLGYQSVQYFSRQFKKLTNMTPSEYSSSIIALSEKPADKYQ